MSAPFETQVPETHTHAPTHPHTHLHTHACKFVFWTAQHTHVSASFETELPETHTHTHTHIHTCRFVLDGTARMRERPIQDLVDGLVQLGVDAKCPMGTGCPPVEINAQGLPSGKVRVAGDEVEIEWRYISAQVLVLPSGTRQHGYSPYATFLVVVLCTS